MFVKRFVLILFVYAGAQEPNNVCSRWEGYGILLPSDRDDPSCYYNPDMIYNIEDIITRHKFTVERFDVTTVDGYILGIYRITNPDRTVTACGKCENGVSVVLAHGIGLTGMAWTNIGSNSLAYVLARSPYVSDVYLVNFRGNNFSNKHVNLTTDDTEYWNFSYHELGVFDVPAVVELVVKTTGVQGCIVYVGFSMGTTAGFIYNAELPDHAKQHLLSMIDMAPIGFMEDITAPATRLSPLWVVVGPILRYFTGGSIMARNPEGGMRTKICLKSAATLAFCSLIQKVLFFGGGLSEMNPETLPITLSNNLDAISLKTVSHYVQAIDCGEFRQYSYGPVKNLRIYGSVVPPNYKIADIPTKISFIVGPADWLSTERNYQRLYDQLRPEFRGGIYEVRDRFFGHDDFVTGKNVLDLAYNAIIEIISNQCTN